MAKKSRKTFKEKRLNSNSNAAKRIIRSEMLSFFPAREYGTRTRLDAMKQDADSYNAGAYGRQSDYSKGAALVDAASLAIYDQDRMLGKIYGKKNVATWDMKKKHDTYKHLVGREYAAMLQERRRKK